MYIMQSRDYLLHPELFKSAPILYGKIAQELNERVDETLVDPVDDDPDISIVIRTRNEATSLERLFEDIHHQRFSREVEVIVVDNESTDSTLEVAHYYGAEIVKL